MPEFNDFRNGVFSLYDLRKSQDKLDYRLANPTPANLRKYCLIRLSHNLPNTDIEILKDFFDPYNKSNNFEKTIDEYPLGKLRALQKLIIKRTPDPDEILVKLLAILVDYQPRPFQFQYNILGQDIIDDSSSTEESLAEDEAENTSTEVSESLPTNESFISKEDREQTAFVNEGDKEIRSVKMLVHSPKKLLVNKYTLRFSGIASLIIAIFFTIHYLTPEDCMCWNGEKYIQVDCQDKTQRYQVIGLDAEKLDHFQKITRIDTLKITDINKIWYSKIDNEVEFFTYPGLHPISPHRPLKAATEHILNKYAGRNAKKSKKED